MSEPIVTVEAAKQALRVAVRARRKAFASGPDALVAIAAIQRHVLALRPDWAGLTVGAYQAMGSEVPLASLEEALEHAGGRVLLPEVVGPSGTVLQFGDPNQVPDIVLVPLIAFDLSGGRLGQGGGYYDATLAGWHEQGHRPATVGIAFACQAVPAVPRAPHDQLLDWIVTQHGAYRATATDRTDA
ncbi:MAG: hypothetical protein MUF14_01445 [Hyphomonadaceae bacterium]|jgi:5-formyltetrahydrofolate cyclo-ligase|nr:hypothetical protein [Hyphomonadaceae bacterium]